MVTDGTTATFRMYLNDWHRCDGSNCSRQRIWFQIQGSKTDYTLWVNNSGSQALFDNNTRASRPVNSVTRDYANNTVTVRVAISNLGGHDSRSLQATSNGGSRPDGTPLYSHWTPHTAWMRV